MLMIKVLASEEFVATSATQPETLIHPVTQESPRFQPCGDMAAIQWYWPPEVGYAERNSPRLAARDKLHIPAVTKPHMTATGPPEGSASEREAARAVHEFNIANARPSIDHLENWRLKD